MTHSLSKKLAFSPDVYASKAAWKRLIQEQLAILQDELEQELYVQGLQRKGEFQTMEATTPSHSLLQIEHWIACKCEAEPREVE